MWTIKKQPVSKGVPLAAISKKATGTKKKTSDKEGQEIGGGGSAGRSCKTEITSGATHELSTDSFPPKTKKGKTGNLKTK